MAVARVPPGRVGGHQSTGLSAGPALGLSGRRHAAAGAGEGPLGAPLPLRSAGRAAAHLPADGPAGRTLPLVVRHQLPSRLGAEGLLRTLSARQGPAHRPGLRAVCRGLRPHPLCRGDVPAEPLHPRGRLWLQPRSGAHLALAQPHPHQAGRRHPQRAAEALGGGGCGCLQLHHRHRRRLHGVGPERQ